MNLSLPFLQLQVYGQLEKITDKMYDCRKGFVFNITKVTISDGIVLLKSCLIDKLLKETFGSRFNNERTSKSISFSMTCQI